MQAIKFREKLKKRALYILFGPNIYCSFNRFDVSLTKYGQDSRGFYMTHLKKWHESIVFLREWAFFDIIYMQIKSVFLENICFLTYAAAGLSC